MKPRLISQSKCIVRSGLTPEPEKEKFSGLVEKLKICISLIDVLIVSYQCLCLGFDYCIVVR